MNKIVTVTTRGSQPLCPNHPSIPVLIVSTSNSPTVSFESREHLVPGIPLPLEDLSLCPMHNLRKLKFIEGFLVALQVAYNGETTTQVKPDHQRGYGSSVSPSLPVQSPVSPRGFSSYFRRFEEMTIRSWAYWMRLTHKELDTTFASKRFAEITGEIKGGSSNLKIMTGFRIVRVPKRPIGSPPPPPSRIPSSPRPDAASSASSIGPGSSHRWLPSGASSSVR